MLKGIIEMEHCTYIWNDPSHKGDKKQRSLCIRSKARILNRQLHSESQQYRVDLFPWWSFDGSSTQSAEITTEGANTELHLKPVFVCRDPLTPDLTRDSKIVLCEVMTEDQESLRFNPAKQNTRSVADEIFRTNPAMKPWFGLEQEYFIRRRDSIDKWEEACLLGSPQILFNRGYYCSMGSDMNSDLQIVNMHLSTCIKAGLSISGANAEVVPGQYEFQIGHIHGQSHQIEGVEAADHLIVARFFLQKCAMLHNADVIIDPKPFKNANGSGAHINYSDAVSRAHGDVLQRSQRLAQWHLLNVKHFGTNTKRLTGEHETSSPLIFSVGRGSRDTTVRIPVSGSPDVYQGTYLEYRLPAADMDPYLCTSMLFAQLTFDCDSEIERFYSLFLSLFNDLPEHHDSRGYDHGDTDPLEYR